MKYRREDWIKAGFKILCDKGIDQVRVEKIARQLGVSKGGFYGYFSNRSVFFQAMLEYWAAALTGEIIKSIGDLEGTLQQKLQRLLRIVDNKNIDDLERAMFSWAAVDEKAQEVVMGNIQRRLIFLEKLFMEAGYAEEDAVNRAAIFHHYMTGCRSCRPLLPKNNSPARDAQLNHFVSFLTGPPLTGN